MSLWSRILAAVGRSALEVAHLAQPPNQISRGRLAPDKGVTLTDPPHNAVVRQPKWAASLERHVGRKMCLNAGRRMLSRLVRRKRVVFRIQGKVGLAHLAGTDGVLPVQVSGRPPDEQVFGQLHSEMVGGFRKPGELK